MQTVRAYETSGGAYIVARENLGTLPSLVGAAALLTDYVLTVAVSISAGIFAVTSFAPSLSGHKVALSLGCLLLIVLVNLRGVRESGLAFALPTYLFVTAVGVLVVAGVIELATGHAHRAVVPHALPVGTGTITLFVLLRAFSSGSTALTGVEAIANGVNAFRRPHGKNAAQTLADPRLDRDLPLPRRLVSRRASARAAELDRVGRLADRARRLPGRVGRELHVLRGAGPDAARSDPRREHVVPGLPAPLGAACARPASRRGSSRTSATGSSSRTGCSCSRPSRACCSGSTARTRTISSTST